MVEASDFDVSVNIRLFNHDDLAFLLLEDTDRQSG